MQPFALTVKLRGEAVVGVAQARAGYCARDIQTLVRGKSVESTLEIVERSCALAGHAHRTATCQAIENALDVAPSSRAQQVRAAFAEIERMLARLWALGQIARAAGVDAAWRDALDQRELLFAALYQTTGERVFWGIPVPGGVRDLDPPLDDAALTQALTRLELALATWRATAGAREPLGRAVAGVGTLSTARARDLALTGIAARAAGLDADLRRDAPYGAYTNLRDAWQEMSSAPTTGDGAARLEVAVDDLATSLDLARRFLGGALEADASDISVDVATAAARRGGADGAATVEGPHGPVSVSLTLTPDGAVERLRLDAPGAGVLAALPELLQDQPVALAPVIIASLDLCVECLDQ